MLRAQEISKQHATEKIYFNKLQKELFAASAAAASLRYSNNECEIASSHEDVFCKRRPNECEHHERERKILKIASRNMLIHLERSWRNQKHVI